MDREIKYRGKNIETGNWVYGHYYIEYPPLNPVKMEDEEEEKEKHWIVFAGFADWNMPRMTQSQVDHETLGLYSELKVQGNKELYEGDVFHLGDENITYVVVWNDTGLMGKQIGSSSYVGLKHWQDRIVLIGNIHDNPELLK
ncbi:MAG: YopX family protein [bacterium]